MKVLLALVCVFGLFGQLCLTPLSQDDHDESIHPTKPAQNDLSMATVSAQVLLEYKLDFSFTDYLNISILLLCNV